MLQSVINMRIPVPAELLIRNVPPHVVRRLRDRALRNRRTLQDELYAIVEAAAEEQETEAN